MKTNSETIIRIGESIKHHRELEVKNYANNIAVGLANVCYQGGDKKLWLTNKENEPVLIKKDGFTGAPVIHTGHQVTIKNDGFPVYKFTKYGECIIRHSKGTHKISTKNGVVEITIKNTSFYTPITGKVDAIDLKLNINETKPRYYRALRELLDNIEKDDLELLRLNEEKEELQRLKEKEVEIKRITDKIDKTKKDRDEKIANSQSFIRKNAELRYQPILDPWQDEIMRSKLFNGTIIIDGGPGTGKTTSLIQRIKFLIDPKAIEEYLPDLTKDKREKLLNNPSNWVFFSPSELLKLFLKNNMVKEGLKAVDEQVLVWSDYKTTLVKKYKLVNSETQNPFLILRKHKDSSLLPIRAKELKIIINSFHKHYLSFQNAKLKKIISIDVSKFYWKNEGNSIQNYLNKQEKNYNFDELIRLYFNLNELFSSEVKSIASEYRELIKKATAEVLYFLEKDKFLKQNAIALIEKWIQESIDEDDDLYIDDDENQIERNPEQVLFDKIKNVIRKKALISYDKSVRLVTKENELENIISKVIVISEINSFDRIGQAVFFMKYFDRSTRGVVGNLISEIPKIYKTFRKAELTSKKNKWNYDILSYILIDEEQKNKRIHPDEQAFILYFINDIVKRTFKISKLKSIKISHSYFQSYIEASKPVIGIDEATDFHLIDLLCIHSFSDYEISSVTYSGDIMQRLSSNGIRSWEEIKPFIKDLQLNELQISYRQSPTLLELAETIYNKATGLKAEYLSFMDKDEKEPKPLHYINEDETEQIEWISKRIIEIYKAYGNSIPSIAVFVNREDEISIFSSKLGNIDRLADVGIEVKGCNNGQVLGDTNTIRVFSISYIKGLEFEAVFFHQIDKIYESSNTEMVLKNLYVGLSRASFYLGITSNERMEEMSFLEEHFEGENLNWEL